jgi:hypothetical protein
MLVSSPALAQLKTKQMETTGNFLKTSLNKALTYTTPEKLLLWLKLQSLISNPPFKTKKW